MSRKFRIDFALREEGSEHGISFGENVDEDVLFDTFNRFRDAAVTVFTAEHPRDLEVKLAALRKERDDLFKKVKLLEEIEELRKLQSRGGMNVASKMPSASTTVRDMMEVVMSKHK